VKVVLLLYWLGADQRLSVKQKEVLGQAGPENPLWVSDITLWEIATLYRLKRLSLSLPLRDWLEAATAPPLIRRAGISPAIAAAIAGLPSSFPRDPADRIIVASAQLLGATVMTLDKRIIQSALVPTLQVGRGGSGPLNTPTTPLAGQKRDYPASLFIR